MAIDFKLPELGENVTTGDVVNVLVQEGQHIEGNQGVIELETEKAVVEIPCPHAGTVAKVHVKKGDTVQVGQTILTVEERARGGAAEAAPAGPAAARPPGEVSATGPIAGESLSRPGGAAAGPGWTAEASAAGPAPLREPLGSVSAMAAGAGVLPAGPAARRLARELGVDLSRVAGSGPRGRITPEDVQAAAAAALSPAGAPPGPTGTPASTLAAGAVWERVVPPGQVSQDAWGQVRREKLSQIRRTIATQMARSASTIPHVTNFDDADITDLEQFRKSVPAGFLGPNLKLTLMPFLMKAVSLALRHHPMLNATLDTEREEIVYKEYIHLGIAVDTPRGLVVPVVRHADRLSLAQLAQALASMAERARAARFTLEELRGGTFTISNLGAVGGTYSTPIINHPEVAILLAGRSRWTPVVRDGRIEPRYLLPLSLSYDHRLVDGATAARFLNEVIDLLESPGKLLLAG